MQKKITNFVIISCLLWISVSFLHHFAEGKTQISQEELSSSSLKKAFITGIRHWSSTTYTRIVIDIDQDVNYEEHLLKEDTVLNKPPRLYIDLKAAKLSTYLKQSILIEDTLLKQVRIGQYNDDTVRVVLDLESVIDYRIFYLIDPYRIVIDVMGKPVMIEKKETANLPAPSKISDIRLILDPGHGGEDPGAIGPTGLREKDVVLEIANKLYDKIKENLRWEVIMTRHDDRFIDLEERTAIANKNDGDLFLSIHANACTNRRIYGIESFFLGTTKDDDALRLAAKENKISPQKVSDLQIILADLKLNDPAKVSPSSKLAECVQEALINRVQKSYGQVKDLGVKRAPFVVLMGADMPSILIEVSFISNPIEENKMKDSKYLNELALAILDGVKRYILDTKMVHYQPPSFISTALNSH